MKIQRSAKGKATLTVLAVNDTKQTSCKVGHVLLRFPFSTKCYWPTVFDHI